MVREDINKIICNYIACHWISEAKSNRAFALDHFIEESTVRKILQEDGYRIPVTTLKKICDARGLKLSAFFELINK